MKWIALVAAVSVAGCGGPTVMTPEVRTARLLDLPRSVGMSEAQVVELFRRAAFVGEDGKALRLARWGTGTIKVMVDGDEAGYWAADVKKVFDELARETGRDIFTSDATVAPHITFTVFRKPAENSGTARGDCGTVVSIYEGQIHSAYIAVDVRPQITRRLMMSCLYEESFQVMGLTGETHERWPSLIDDMVYYDGLTPADRILLRTLYDPRLRPGMTWGEAQPLVRTIIRENMAR